MKIFWGGGGGGPLAARAFGARDLPRLALESGYGPDSSGNNGIHAGSQARFRRRTSHEPNRMLLRENKGLFAFAFDSAHVKYGV